MISTARLLLRATGVSILFLLALYVAYFVAGMPMRLLSQVLAIPMGRHTTSTLSGAVVEFFVTRFFLLAGGTSLTQAGLRLQGISLKQWTVGFAIGLLALSLVLLIPLAAGAAEIAQPEDTCMDKGLSAWWIGLAALRAMGEELTFRGYLLRTWTRYLSLPAGLLASSLIFALLHLPNAGFNAMALLNTFLAGVLLGLVYAKSGSLWVAGGIHTGWNVAQPLFGVAMSGHAICFPTLRINFTAGTLWSGGLYGPEASLAATAVLLALVPIAISSRWQAVSTAPGSEASGLPAPP